MTTNYLNTLEAKIAFLRDEVQRHMDEIERLEIGRSVILDLQQGRGLGQTLTLRAEPQKKTEAITIRKIDKPVRKPHRTSTVERIGAKELRDRILNVLDRAPLDTMGMARQLSMYDTESNKKRVSNSLYYLKQQGIVAVENGLYRLASSPRPSADEKAPEQNLSTRSGASLTTFHRNT